MDLNSLYTKFNFSPEEIEDGNELWSSFNEELRNKFLSDIYGEYNGEGFYSVYHKYGKFPASRKVILCDIALSGTEQEKVQLAWNLSHPFNQRDQYIEDFFPLLFTWIQNTTNSKIYYWLSFGLLYYLDKPEARDFIDQNIKSNQDLAKAMVEWLMHQPKWYRSKFINEEIIYWEQLQISWPFISNDPYTARQIQKAIGLEYDKNELWYHEIDNPNHYSFDLIQELADSGIQIKIIPIGEIGMGAPRIDKIILNGKEITVAGPFQCDDKKEYLCCKQYSYDNGNHNFKLVLINLNNSEIIDLGHWGDGTIPFKFENDEFIILRYKYLRKVNLETDSFRIPLPLKK